MTGALVGVAAGGVLISVWLLLAGAVNALDEGERFRLPLILFVANGLLQCALLALEAPQALQSLVSLTLGLPMVVLYWTALGRLSAALQSGSDEVTA